MKYILYSIILFSFACTPKSEDEAEQSQDTFVPEEKVQAKPLKCTLTGLFSKAGDGYVFPKGSGAGNTIEISFEEKIYVSELSLDNLPERAWISKVVVIYNDEVESLAIPISESIPVDNEVKKIKLIIEECVDERFVIYERPGGYRVVTGQNPDKVIGFGGLQVLDKEGKPYSLDIKLVCTSDNKFVEQLKGTPLEDLINNRLGNYSIFGEDSSIVTEFEYGLRESFRDKYIQYDKFSELLLKSDKTFQYLSKSGSKSEVEELSGSWSVKSADSTRAAILLGDQEVTVTEKDIEGGVVELMLRKLYKHYFVNIKECYPEAGYAYDMRYASDNNFLKKDVYEGCANCFLREDAAKALLKAQNQFRQKGFRIKFFDCYRPLDIQKKMWEIYPHPGYVADPAKGSMHNRGAAVDITLVNMDGNELDMGTGFDHFGREAWHAYEELADTVKANRLLLKSTLESAGFRPIRTEWWHYSLIKPGGHPVANVPICIE